MTCTQVGLLIVGNIVNLVLVDKVFINNPGGLRDHLIDPATMPNRFGSRYDIGKLFDLELNLMRRLTAPSVS
jgi:hypothetical protein